jgi:hypothetical protein
MVGEWYVASWRLKGCSPCLCWLRTDGLTPTSKYSTYRSHAGVYGPSKPSSRLSTEVWHFSIASLAVVEEKLGTDPQMGQPSCFGLYWEPLVSGAVDLFKYVDDYANGCNVLTVWDTYGLGSYAYWAWDAYDMLVRFPPVWCTSIRTAATFGYE